MTDADDWTPDEIRAKAVQVLAQPGYKLYASDPEHVCAVAAIDGLRYREAWEALDFVLDRWEVWAKDDVDLSGPDEALLTAIAKARAHLAGVS